MAGTELHQLVSRMVHVGRLLDSLQGDLFRAAQEATSRGHFPQAEQLRQAQQRVAGLMVGVTALTTELRQVAELGRGTRH